MALDTTSAYATTAATVTRNRIVEGKPHDQAPLDAAASTTIIINIIVIIIIIEFAIVGFVDQRGGKTPTVSGFTKLLSSASESRYLISDCMGNNSSSRP